MGSKGPEMGADGKGFRTLNDMYSLNKSLAIRHALEFGTDPSLFNLPERILQFGTGVLLRGLADWIVDKANKQQVFNGRIVVIRSTGTDHAAFDSQDNLYTVIEKGLVNQEPVNRSSVITSISRVLNTYSDWSTILECAGAPGIDIIISNTTEAGLVYLQEDILQRQAPASFPGKLTRYLWERYQVFAGSRDSGMIILPAELITDNGMVLKDLVIRQSENNHLPRAFIHWLQENNRFCNTLVDRIVPGKSLPDDQMESGGIIYSDQLYVVAEPFLLWAIEGGAEIKKRLPFQEAEPRMVVTPDITPLREQKLRILNGSNSLVAALAYLYGCNTTLDTMQDKLVCRYVTRQIDTEILPTIAVNCPASGEFAAAVLERFRNPDIRYPLLNIALQYCAKMDSRCGPTFIRYYTLYSRFPPLCSLGMAAFLLFHLPAGQDQGGYFGMRAEEKYPYRDEHAPRVCALLADMDFGDYAEMVNRITLIFSDKEIFQTNLAALEGFAGHIAGLMNRLHQQGIRATLKQILASSSEG